MSVSCFLFYCFCIVTIYIWQLQKQVHQYHIKNYGTEQQQTNRQKPIHTHNRLIICIYKSLHDHIHTHCLWYIRNIPFINYMLTFQHQLQLNTVTFRRLVFNILCWTHKETVAHYCFCTPLFLSNKMCIEQGNASCSKAHTILRTYTQSKSTRIFLIKSYEVNRSLPRHLFADNIHICFVLCWNWWQDVQSDCFSSATIMSFIYQEGEGAGVEVGGGEEK